MFQHSNQVSGTDEFQHYTQNGTADVTVVSFGQLQPLNLHKAQIVS
jgi:hypothetical protein